jgi:hypothetical protein
MNVLCVPFATVGWSTRSTAQDLRGDECRYHGYHNAQDYRPVHSGRIRGSSRGRIRCEQLQEIVGRRRGAILQAFVHEQIHHLAIFHHHGKALGTSANAKAYVFGKAEILGQITIAE